MAKLAHLKFNDLAPDVELLTVDGGHLRLSTLWSQQTLLLSFIRHFGCPQCKEMLDILVQAQPELARHDLAIAVITHANPEETRQFCAERAPGLRCLADPEREAYRLFGLGRGGLTQTVLSPKVLSANRRLQKAKGYKAELPPPGQDAMQMSGIFIIGTDGRIRLPYYYDDIADHPPVELLTRGVMGMEWDKPFDAPIHGE